MNVLLTSAGRRSYLVRYFQQALAGRGQVLVANCLEQAAAMHFADQAFLVPASNENGYGEAILAICKQHAVGLICSCHDLDTLALSAIKPQLINAGAYPMLPNHDWALRSLDKLSCSQFLRDQGFSVPWNTISVQQASEALDHGDVRFPLVVKARYGFGSLGFDICRSFAELEYVFRHMQNFLPAGRILSHYFGQQPADHVMIEEYVEGKELRLLCVNNFAGHFAAHFLTEIHAMRAGESDWATTLEPSLLDDLPQRLAALTRHVGIWGFDIIMKDDQPFIIDVNPRFTGDYPFHHLAGADVPAALLAWAADKDAAPFWLRSESGVTGFKDLVPTLARGLE